MLARRTILAATCAAALSFAAGTAGAEESKGTLNAAMLDWTGTHITMKVAGGILERMGYDVNYVQTTQYPMFQAMADGDLDFYLEQWMVTSRHAFEEFEQKGELVDLGPLGLEGYEGWFYPTYVEADCPGLPDWKALAECEELFASPETFPNGRVVDYPEEWTPDSAKWADALGLEITPVPAGGEGAIAAEVKSAFARQEPVLVMFWKPHWIFAEHEMDYIRMPEFDEACETDPSWGINPDKTFDCGAPVPPIQKIARPGLESEHPEAWAFLKAYKMTNDMQQPMMVEVEVNGRDLDEVVNEWIDNNEDVWQPWVDKARMAAS